MFWQPHFPGSARLTGPKFFPTTWAESPGPLASPFTEPVEQRAFSPCPSQSSSFGHLETEVLQNSESSGMRHPVRPGGEDAAPTLGPPTPHRTGEHANPGPRGIPFSLHNALPSGQWPQRHLAGGGARQPCGLTRSSLWAFTRKQRIAAKERSTRRSNALFWKSWRPAAQHSTQQLEAVVPTPHDTPVQPEPGCKQKCKDAASEVGEPTKLKPTRLAPSATSGHRRKRRPRPTAASVPQLRDLASLLRCKPAEDPSLQSAALACADWVEGQGLPEEALESQLVWQVLEHCSGTPGPLDLPTLAAFADIANTAHAPGQPKSLTLAIANITRWRKEILHWFQQTSADCLLAQETRLSLDQESRAQTTLHNAGLHSFWAGATPTNRTKGGLVVATPWQAHPRLVHSFTVDGCGFLAVELPRVKWRLVLISVYLQSGTGLHTEPNATILAQLLAFVQRIPNWVAAGDWNVDLDKFASTNIAVEARGQILGSHEAAISSGNTLDFVLASRSVAGLLQLRVDKVVPFAPHYCLVLEIDVAHGLLNLPAIKGFSSTQHLLKTGQCDSPSRPNLGDKAEETGDSPLQEPLLVVEGGFHPHTPPQGRARHLTFDIGGALLEPSAATRNFAAFSRSAELELLGKTQGRGACNPVEHRPVLRDDRHASRWHERPAAILSQIRRLVRGLVTSQPPPAELLDLALQYLSEEKQADAPTPDWAAALGLAGGVAPAARPVLTQELVTSIATGIQQESSLCKLQVSQRSKESYSRWLSGSSVGGLKPLYKCIRKYEASVERPFPSFSAASKLMLRLQQWSQLWKSTGTKPAPDFEDLKRRACEQAQSLPAISCDRVEQFMRRAPLKAPGPDGRTPHLMRGLTTVHCQRLASLMRQAELSGSFPEQWTVSLVILLPKTPEIERPIALMHVLLKAWMKLRWSLLEQWQASFAPRGWWDSCGPGHSCLDVAVRRLIQYEASHTVQEHRVTLYLDLSCHHPLAVGHPCAGSGLSTPASVGCPLCLQRTPPAFCRRPCRTSRFR